MWENDHMEIISGIATIPGVEGEGFLKLYEHVEVIKL